MEFISLQLPRWGEIESDPAVWPFRGDDYEAEIGADQYEKFFKQVERIEEYGYDGVAWNEHHYSAYSMNPSPIVTASHATAITDELTLAFLGNVVPIRGNPVRVAEELAMLDTFSKGRVLAGIARGIPMEYTAYNVDLDDSRSRFKEAYELIKKTWSADEPFDWDGEHWQYEDITIWPRPYQEPHPQFCMPSGSETSARFAAKRRIPIAQAFGMNETKEVFDAYREIAEEEFDWTPTDEHFMLGRTVYVADSEEQAREEAEKHLEYHWNKLFGGIHRGVAVELSDEDEWDRETHYEMLNHHGKKAVDFDLDEFIESGEVVIGTPNDVTEQLERQYDHLGGFGTMFVVFRSRCSTGGDTTESAA